MLSKPKRQYIKKPYTRSCYFTNFHFHLPGKFYQNNNNGLRCTTIIEFHSHKGKALSVGLFSANKKNIFLLKLVTFVHFFLLANAMLGSFLPQSYLFYNILFLVSLFWTMHCKESVDAIHTVSCLTNIFFLIAITIC